MNSPELPLWQRVTTAVLLVAAAWFVRGSGALVDTVGASAVRLSAGVAALSVLLGMKLRPGMWPTRLARDAFSMPAALAIAAAGGLAIALSGRGGPGDDLWAFDRGGIAGVVVGAAALSVIVGRSRVQRSWVWLAVAAVAGASPWVMGLISLKAGNPTAISLDGRMLTGAVVFFVVTRVLTVLVTDELAFRRLVVGRAGSGAAMVLTGAFVYGVWATFLPAGPGGPFLAFVTGAITGVAAGSLFLLSRSLLVSAVFTGTASGGIAATLQALGAGGTPDAHLLSFVNCASAAVLVPAVVFGLMVWRRFGVGMVGEYEVGGDAAGS